MTTAKQASKQTLQATKAGKILASYSKSRQEGFTIIESLVAIVVVSVLLAAIAPVIILSVATRVQARRVEFATQAAKSYIDGVRTKQIEPPSATSDSLLKDFPAPTNPGSLNCAANSYCTTTGTTSTGTPPSPTNLYCIDFDGDNTCKNSSTTDMVVQVFRNKTSTTGYALGVRVYRANAFKSGITFKALKDSTSNNPIKQQQTFTGGTGLGNQQAPLVEMSTDITDTVPSYGDLCNRLQGSDPTNQPLDKGCSTN
ncbi:hormogonium polysaccharide secretion pseudopilin HpsB [Plectonema radiosum NIES-515]|uniref:Hormogonium polysaccharide secretion pseudopilin HpsB n=1 Tax=Plectonema radiosum NIES-515 TaxID=2986073 RepID=A0ABT3B5X4_9CYAN|nr:hormogonium polysaccharide secretion pseudopilin HpsB [Plectonema radiosum]MCV3216761.1 hormogonium polysaccharide secretion pseudopilin HpsB [Plectonema radiosum NIES-515]